MLKKLRRNTGRRVKQAASEAAAPAPADPIAQLIASATSDMDFVFRPTPEVMVFRGMFGLKQCSVAIDDRGMPVLTLSGGRPDATAGGRTGGFSVQVPDAFEVAASGHSIRVRVVARAAQDAPAARFAVAYSTAEVGNSGWQWFDLSQNWAVFEMSYAVRPMVNGNGDYIGMLAPPDGEPGVQVCAVAAAVDRSEESGGPVEGGGPAQGS